MFLGDRMVGEWQGDLEDRLGHDFSNKIDGASATRITFNAVLVEQGSVLKIVGQPDGTELAPLDYGGPGEGLTWASHLQVAFAQANVSAFLYWEDAENATASSSLINLIGNEIVTSKRYWVFAQFSEFVRPGAHRVDAASNNPLVNVRAFRNTNDVVAVQVLNDATTEVTVQVNVQGLMAGDIFQLYLTNKQYDLQTLRPIRLHADGQFEGRVPAHSLVSFVSNQGVKRW